MSIVIKACTLEDLTELRAVAYVTYKDTFEGYNSQTTMDAYLEEAFDLQKLEKEVSNPLSFFYFVMDHEEVVGYMKVNLPTAQTDFNDLEAMELERIYVKKAYKGRGYGQEMVAKVISMTREQGLTSIWLGVWANNTPAKKFYEKLGFEKVGEHGFRMGNELQTDHIYRLKL